MTKTVRISLLLIFVFQLLMTLGFELAHDEAYYWLYSRHLSWGFFDHPPFVGAVIKLFSFLPHSEFSVRIGFVVLQFLSYFFLTLLGANPATSLLLFFSFPLASFTGLFALPDIPLLFMTACYCLQLKKYLEDDSLKNSSILGLVIALLFYAKYHGVLLVFFTIMAVPKLLVRKSFYVTAVVAIVGFAPHMWWQYQHEFATVRYHFLERPSAAFSWKRSLEFVGLQVILAGFLAGPAVWYGIFKNKTRHEFDRSMKFISIGTVLFFLISSFSKRVEANWTIFLAIPMIYLVSNSDLWKKKWASYLLITSFWIVLVLRLLLILPPEQIAIKRLGEFHGWKSWAQLVAKDCGSHPIMANSYQVASKLSFYLNQEIHALNYHSRKNQFDYWRFDKAIPTKEVCYITDKNDFLGVQLLSPDGKTLRVVKNQSIERLWELKYSQTR